jgi:hypothetical protein
VAAVHSLLASRAAKEWSARRIGRRNRNALYRPVYIAHSVASFGGLLLYARSLPDKVLWEVRGGPAMCMQVCRLIALGLMARAAREVGIPRMLGIPGLQAWWRGEADVPAEPEAQGPAPDNQGILKANGPFRFSRHPLNFLGIPVLWPAPRMTRNLFVFNSLATLYLVLGSIHEERRLRRAYGEAYEAYRRSAPFLAGRPAAREACQIIPAPADARPGITLRCSGSRL